MTSAKNRRKPASIIIGGVTGGGRMSLGPSFVSGGGLPLSFFSTISIGSIVKLNCLMKKILRNFGRFCQYYV